MRTPLELYTGKAGMASSWGMKDRPLKPGQCPCQVVDSGRVTYINPCSRQAKPGTLFPVRDRFGKEDVEREVCGVHAGVYKRALQKYEREQHEAQVRKDQKAQVQEMADRLERLLGVKVRVEEKAPYNKPWEFTPTGKVIVDAAKLLEVLDAAPL